MSSKRVRLISFIGLILIALIIGVSLLISLLSKDSQEIPLPSAGASAGSPDVTGLPANNGLEHVAITKDNVQAVIATLKRPPFYTWTVQVEQRYEGDSTIYDISASIDKDASAMKITSPVHKNIVIAGGKLYIWYDGDKTPYERPVLSAEDEKKSSDEYQMMMSYEDILTRDKNSITDAVYKEYSGGGYSGERCIYVQYVTELLHYTVKCYISVNSGLLIYAEKYDGDTLIYKMTTSDYNEAEPDPAVFSLPDGTNPVTAP